MNGVTGATSFGAGSDTAFLSPSTATCACAGPALSTTGAAASESATSARIHGSRRTGFEPTPILVPFPQRP